MSSKIKVDTIENVAGSGNVSLGSGHNLVVPGNITGQGTAAITGNTTVGGTLGVTGTATLSGNATIGTNSGDTRFSLNSANQYTMVLKNAGNIAGQIGGGGADVLRFSNAAGATIMEMNAGRTTLPFQPAFSTYGTAGNVSFTGGQEPIITSWNTMIFNVGGHFNTSTGKFTAPIAGKYFFRSQLYMQNFTGVFRFRIYKNTSVAVYHYYAAAASPGPAFIAGFLNLAANDTVHLTGNADNTGNIYFADNHSNFDGYLVL